MLPIEFTERMQEILGDEYPDFLASYDKPKYTALRINPAKANLNLEQIIQDFELSQVPWAEYGHYYKEPHRPGKHPYHDAGAYYIQEPSAMVPASLLDVHPGQIVLDLCAAPGGKSTQIASALRGDGLLISNEIMGNRAKILSENIERMGIANCLVISEDPENLAPRFPEFFDRIMVDAPCSGEGMFRKNEDAITEWSIENVRICASRQDSILDCAAAMLSPGGRMVFSTCTFAPEENEGSILRFLSRHKDFHLCHVDKYDGMCDGIKPGTEDAIRLWPHRVKGEGHFTAVLEKDGSIRPIEERILPDGFEADSLSKKKSEKPVLFYSFAKETLEESFYKTLEADRFLNFGENLYYLPEHCPRLKGLKVLRPGLHLGTQKKDRFEPAHALALALSESDVLHTSNLTTEEAEHYIHGETYRAEGEKGWYLITVDHMSLAFGKLAGGTMKNHYPKGLRRP